MRLRYIFSVACLLLYTCRSFAQTSAVDSLKKLVNNAPEDTQKVNLLNDLCKSLWTSEHQEEVIAYGSQAKALAEKLNFKRGLAYAYKNIGRGYFNQSKYLEALQYYENSLAVFDSIGDKSGVANMNTNLGNVYLNKGDDEKALVLFLKSLKISEELNDTLRMLTALGNIGAVYTMKKNTYDEALVYLLRAYPLSEALQDDYSTGNITANIGEIYYKKFDVVDSSDKSLLDSALFFFKKSLAAYGDAEDASYTLNYVGKVYMKEKKYDEAVKNQQAAYALAEKAEARNDMAIALLALAETYKAKGDSKLALATYKQAEPLAKGTESKYTLKDIYDGLSQVYADVADIPNAFKYQHLLIAIKDTIYNLETDKKLGTLSFQYENEKKKSQIDLLTKDQELKEKEISRQKLARNSFMGGFAIVLLFAGVFFTQRNRISKEKKRSDELLLNILPEETAEELKATGTAKAKSFDMVTVLFTDFKNFTQASEKLSPEALVAEINYCYSEFDRIITLHGIEKIKTIGDAYMCAGGLPSTNTTNPVDVVRAGLEMVEFIEKNKAARIAKDQPFFELRCGIHSGPVVAGIVGIKKFAYDIWGDTVNTASRMESSGEIGKVNISGATYELVKDHFTCVHRGKVKAKNKGEIDMYFVSRSLGEG
jgi:adenylate cyclase